MRGDRNPARTDHQGDQEQAEVAKPELAPELRLVFRHPIRCKAWRYVNAGVGKTGPPKEE